jgi:glutathione peroxidase
MVRPPSFPAGAWFPRLSFRGGPVYPEEDPMKALCLLLMSASAYAAGSIHEFTLPSIDGQPAPLAAYKGKVALLVNVASQCGYTPQYKGLEAVYRRYKDRGFTVLGFPSNDFGQQEPGDNTEIKTFCTRNYHVTFPMYGKVPVKGADKTPLYGYLTQTGGEVKWNFTKFLVDGDGKVIARFDSAVDPESAALTEAVEKALARSAAASHRR